MFYKNAEEIKDNTGMSIKKAKLLLLQDSTYLDTKKWIEAFCCPNHGMMWLLISIEENSYKYRLAREEDWSKADKTLEPRVSNPSVSEYTLRVSRKANANY
ncbi:MAG: hypothetical protein AAGE84_13845 [Cyanobacteria bacterium P01_G01_bin.39]